MGWGPWGRTGGTGGCPRAPRPLSATRRATPSGATGVHTISESGAVCAVDTRRPPTGPGTCVAGATSTYFSVSPSRDVLSRPNPPMDSGGHLIRWAGFSGRVISRHPSSLAPPGGGTPAVGPDRTTSPAYPRHTTRYTECFLRPHSPPSFNGCRTGLHWSGGAPTPIRPRGHPHSCPIPTCLVAFPTETGWNGPRDRGGDWNSGTRK